MRRPARVVDPRWVTASGALLDEFLDFYPPSDREIVWSITNVGEAHDYREDGARGIRVVATVLAVTP